MSSRFKNILVPTDFSETAGEAAKLASELVAPGGTVTLCHVVDDTPLTYGYVGVTLSHPELQSRLSREAEAELEKVVVPDPAGGASVERIILHGSPFVGIVRHARENAVDLIVMGTHGRTGMSHILIGSVAEKVVRKSHCPVLVVRPKDVEFKMP